MHGVAYTEEFPEERPGNIVLYFPIGTAHTGGYIQKQDKIDRSPCLRGGNEEGD
jgi:hypothetical protein